MQVPIFKIVSESEWESAVAAGEFSGSAVDRADGFIHFSTAAQVRETAARHFAGRTELVLVAVAADTLDLRWEPARGGELFPHLYGALPVAAVLWTAPLPWNEQGHRFPDQLCRQPL